MRGIIEEPHLETPVFEKKPVFEAIICGKTRAVFIFSKARRLEPSGQPDRGLNGNPEAFRIGARRTNPLRPLFLREQHCLRAPERLTSAPHDPARSL
jgi:hypothetical protein